MPQNRRRRRHLRTTHATPGRWLMILTIARIIFQAATWWYHGEQAR